MINNAKQRMSTLSDEQKRLLAQRLSRRRPGGTDAIRRQPAEAGPFPLSFAQQRFWFLTQLGPHSTAYNISELHRLKGRLDATALSRSLTEIVRRHDVLRTTFQLADGLPVQRIGEPFDVTLPTVDLRAVPDAERDAEWRRLATEEARRPWDLVNGPVFRARLWRLADDDHRLLMLMHHIVGDGWSQGVLINELAAIYDAFSNGRPSPLPELPIQYADFAVWQREWAEGPDFERQLAYWKQSLQDPPVLQVPALRTGVPSARGTHKRFYFSDELTQALRGLCQREGVTLFMALLAALTALLSRYSGQEDVVVGSPIANRDRPELEPLIGCFMNPLPIRCHVGGNPTFRSLLRRVRESALGAFANQNVPFDVLVRTLHAARDGSNTPLFQVMFLLQNVGLRALRLSESGLAAPVLTDVGELTLPDDSEYPGDLMYPVALEVIEVGKTVGATIEYADHHALTLSGFPGHLRTLLRAAIDAPDAPVSELPILTAAERERVLVAWNRDTLPRSEVCVPALIAAQAARDPGATGVVFGDVRLTYGELDCRARRLAGRLVRGGAGPDVPIGILIDRSADMVAAVVGVLNSGSAYVPLDPSYPPDRLRFIAHDAGLRRIVTTRAAVARLPELAADAEAGLFTWEFVDDLAEADGEPEPIPAVDPGQLAYVIYTSGTTGRPKGTMVSHASLANAYRAWERAYDLPSLRAHLQMASLSFDVFSGDLVRALCSGAALVVVPQELLFSPASLHALIEREQVDAAEFVPVVLRDLAQHLESTGGTLPTMRLLVAGSDSWYNHEYARLRALCGDGTRVVNSYGLTEATIDSTYFDGGGPELAADGLVPLGRAFPNTEILLLDRHLQPVPIGVAAELFVGGAGLARGYLRRPDLTAERFVPHPFSTEPGARLYRTGDLGRRLQDGTLELLGRIDQQVKLRGYRIELAEIESALLALEAVTEAAAMVREDRPGDRRLVAYVVTPRGDTTPAQLRQHLRETMPEYMVPSAIVRVDALPLTPNGKVDRGALPAPDGERQSEETYVPPHTETEQRLAALWRDVLRIEQVGVNDNFFDLGGHSLLVVQLHGRVRAAFDVELSVLDLFRHPTIAALARHMAGTQEQVSQAGVFDARARARRQREAAARRRAAAPVRAGRG